MGYHCISLLEPHNPMGFSMSRLTGASLSKQLPGAIPLLTGATSTNVPTLYNPLAHSGLVHQVCWALLSCQGPQGYVPLSLCQSKQVHWSHTAHGPNPCLLNSTSDASQSYPCQPGIRIPSTISSAAKQHFIGSWEPIYPAVAQSSLYCTSFLCLRVPSL